MQSGKPCSTSYLVFGASLRVDSFNKKLATLAANVVEEAGWRQQRLVGVPRTARAAGFTEKKATTKHTKDTKNCRFLIGTAEKRLFAVRVCVEIPTHANGQFDHGRAGAYALYHRCVLSVDLWNS